METSDFLVVGAGVIGVGIASELKKRYPDAQVTVIEKEPDCGLHASGRNSGVLHAGFYYFPDSLKAKFTREGNLLLTEYCESNGLRINKCGKLVVAKNESELKSLDVLLERARANNVPLDDITVHEAKKIEPRVKTYERALFSPSTSSVDPQEVMQCLKRDAQSAGVQFRFGESFVSREANGDVTTTKSRYSAKYVVNSAGLYADRLAMQFGFSEHYRILPFKGLYLYSEEPVGAVKVHVYPVPDLRNPFLGVHYTLTVDGKIKIGPTAIPAFWREQYAGFANFSAQEFFEIVSRQLGLVVFSEFDFKKLAVAEMRKYSRRVMAEQAGEMLSGVSKEQFQKWGKPGIRAQLLDLRTKKLEMDFVFEGDDKSMHVLNAVSPAFTCSLPFSRYVCDAIDKRLKN